MSRRTRNQDDFCAHFQRLSLHDHPGTSQGPSQRRSPSKKNTNLPLVNQVTYRNLHPTEEMYQKIQDLITNENFVIENIVEVYNPDLQKTYSLKRSQKQRQFGEVYECLLFHGTKKANVGSICTHNFNWRLFGTNKGHKYGKGVSFSVSAQYASYYSDPDEYHKVMVVAKVLIANVCQGHAEMEHPPRGYDSSQKGDNGAVLVKYEDHEFYPAYKLYYHLDDDDEDEESEEAYHYD